MNQYLTDLNFKKMKSSIFEFVFGRRAVGVGTEMKSEDVKTKNMRVDNRRTDDGRNQL